MFGRRLRGALYTMPLYTTIKSVQCLKKVRNHCVLLRGYPSISSKQTGVCTSDPEHILRTEYQLFYQNESLMPANTWRHLRNTAS